MKKLLVSWSHYGKLNWLTAIVFNICFLSQPAFTQNYASSTQLTCAQQFLGEQLGHTAYRQSNFQCMAIRQSPYTTYFSFQQLFNQIPIENAIVKIGVNTHNQITYFNGNYYATANLPEIPTRLAVLKQPYILPNGATIPMGTPMQPMLRFEENNIMYVYTYNWEGSDGTHYTLISNEQGDITECFDHRMYFSGADSTVQAKVFLPDPLTTAGVTYGSPYSDNNDTDIPELNNEAALVNMQVWLEDGVFSLRNNNIVIKDINAPTAPVVTSEIPEFYFTRSESGFEDVNTFFHVTNFCHDIINAGYATLQDFYIEIDPHGASGADQSFYVSAAIPSIQFGEGGVDDAEDADVIIHEFTHALSDHASPGSNSGLERRAVDEGYGDYFAASYSRKFSDFNWQNIFSWDGHNEFWFGRNANTSKQYPDDNSENIYAASEIWSGALMDIYDLIGKENCDQLVYEALFGSFPNMTMPEAAQLILVAEETIFGGIWYTPVFDALYARGLIYPNSTVAYNNLSIQINNTAGFAVNNEPLVIQVPQYCQVHINCFTAEGKLTDSFTGSGDYIHWTPNIAQSGIYLIEVITEFGATTTKVVKY